MGEQIICGVESPLDIAVVRSNAQMLNWGAHDSDYIEDFWAVLKCFNNEEMRRFVVFVSACGRMPPQGWQAFDLQVQKNGIGNARLPTAYTCFNLLLLPRYTSKEILTCKLRDAVAQTEGFGLE